MLICFRLSHLPTRYFGYLSHVPTVVPIIITLIIIVGLGKERRITSMVIPEKAAPPLLLELA